MIWGRLFLDGAFPSTNEALALAKAEAVYRSKAGGRMPPGSSYSMWAKSVRERVALGAVRAIRRLPDDVPVDVGFYLLRHPKYDADAWTMAGKWALDGLVDAKLIASDRRLVNRVGGRCLQTAEQSDAFALGHDTAPRRRGLLIEIDEVSW